MTTTGRGFQRMSVDDRRDLLLEQGRRLFTTHAYDELSMATIAGEAGISKALLYHYFPSKQAYFVATLSDAATELADRIRPDGGRPPRDQLESALDVWLGWVDDNGEAYCKLLRAASGASEVRDIVDGVRDATAAAIAERLLDGAASDPSVRNVTHGWLWFMDGVCLDWVRYRDLDRDHVRQVLLDALPCALAAGGRTDLARLLSA